jgi:hypothetical protein
VLDPFAAPPPGDEEPVLNPPRLGRALALGALAALPIGVVYGIATEPFGLSWGLLAIGFFGGILIGSVVKYGAWAGVEHTPNASVSSYAGLLAVGAGILGLFVAFVVSQALYPQATTSLLERITLDGFLAYATGLFDLNRVIHGLAFAITAVAAWRWAR